MTVLFGIDVGTSATKGLAISDAGEVLATEEAPYPLSTPRPGWSEQDPEDWWRATEAVLATLERKAGAPAGIGLSGQMHGLVALDENDDVIRPAILWNDQRTQAECDEIEETIGLDRLIELTGNRALTGFTAPKILWVRNHEPDNYARIAHVLLPKDYVRLRLTGEHATDVSDASGMLLLDVANRAWSDEVLQALDIDPAWLANVLESPEVSGRHGRRRARRRRRRRPGRRRSRSRGRSQRAGIGGARDLGRRVRRARRVRGQPGGPRPRVLPRGPRRLARDGRDAVGRWLAQLVAPRLSARDRLRRAAGTKRLRGLPAPRVCCSSPTSPASAPPTPTRMPAERSSGSASATTGAR